MASECSHLDRVSNVSPQTDGCQECLATGDDWVETRMCMTCGHVGCCDSSKNKHATAHYRQTGHPVMSAKPSGKDWAWCYVDETYIRPIPRPRAAA